MKKKNEEKLPEAVPVADEQNDKPIKITMSKRVANIFADKFIAMVREEREARERAEAESQAKANADNASTPEPVAPVPPPKPVKRTKKNSHKRNAPGPANPPALPLSPHGANMTKQPTKPTKLTAAAYVRMSTDQQSDSPARQRADIEALAAREGVEVTKWYQDHGKTGTESKKRGEFQQLLKDAQAGKFKVLLLSEQSRMSREHTFEVMEHWKILRDAGVQIITAQRGRLDFSSVGGLVTAMVDAFGAHDESRKLAERTVGGKRLSIARGQRQGGAVFGFDRIIRDQAGKVLKRVHFREKFAKPRGYTSSLVISEDEKAVEAVRHSFTATLRGELVADIWRWFHDQGITSVRGNNFCVYDIMRLLTNPIYTGTVQHGLQTGLHSKFARVLDQPVTVENAVPAIVSREVFDAVQAVLRGRKRKRTRGPAGQYVLAGLLRCGVCDARLYGGKGTRKHGSSTYYMCRPVAREAGSTVHVTVSETPVLKSIATAIREFVLTPENRESIAEMLAGHGRESRTTTPDQDRLSEVLASIAKAELNLALASNPEEYASTSRILTAWREEVVLLRARIRKLSAAKPSEDVIEAIAGLEWVRDNFESASRPLLADMLKGMVDRIVINHSPDSKGNVRERPAHTGQIYFASNVYPEPVPLPTLELPLLPRLEAVVNFLRAAGRDCRTTEILAGLKDISPRTVEYNLIKGKGLGVITLVNAGHSRSVERIWRATHPK